MAVAHRRAGKTLAFLNEAIRKACQCPRPNPHFGYIAPFLYQSKAIAWNYVKQICAADPEIVFNETELRADFPGGARIRLFGADNPDALRGLYFDGVILDEFGDTDPRLWTDVIRPALSDRQGWAAFAGTPRGKNHFYELVKRAEAGEAGWALFKLKASETRLLTAEELADARVSMEEHAYEREYECSFDAAVEGAYFARELAEAEKSGRVTDLRIEDSVPVNTAWDIGIDDATAIWFFQDVGRERRLIDYLEVSGLGLREIARQLDRKGYVYGRHILPHDADAAEKSSGESYRRTFEKLGFRNVEIVPRTNDLIGAINSTRLHIARCWFDREACARGLECLKQYHRDWDRKLQTWRDRPTHDWTSHAADAFRALALSAPPRSNRYVEIVLPNYGIY